MNLKKIENYMEIADVVAKRSHDSETKVGAILVKNDTGSIIATSFNGFVRSAPDDKLPTTRPDKYEFIIHAEQNIITQCARYGISMDNCTLYCTLTPCKTCMRLLYQTGITNIIAKKKYKGFDELLTARDIKITYSDMVNSFIHLQYENAK